MNKMLNIMTRAFVLLIPLFSFQAFSVSDDECAILICAPVGFMDSNCKAAKRAMHKRVLKGKPPAPRFDQCSEETPDTGNMEVDNYIAENEKTVEPNVDIKEGIGAYIAPQPHACAGYRTIGGSNSSNEICYRWVDVPEEWIKDISCIKQSKGYLSSPPFCTRTLKYQQAMIDGYPSGHVYYSDGHLGEQGGYQDDLGDLIMFQTNPNQDLESQYQDYHDAVNSLSEQDEETLREINSVD